MLMELGTENLYKAFGRAAKELKRHPLRVHSKERLLEVKGIGPNVASVCPQNPGLSSCLCAQYALHGHVLEGVGTFDGAMALGPLPYMDMASWTRYQVVGE